MIPGFVVQRVFHYNTVAPACNRSEILHLFTPTSLCSLPFYRGLFDIYRLLNVYCEIFGTRSYGGDALASSCVLRHMNSCRIFHNIHFTLIVSFIPKIYIRNQNIISANEAKNCFKFMPFGVFIPLQNHAQRRENER